MRREKWIGGIVLAGALALPASAPAAGPAGYQIDPSHTGEARGTRLAPPLGKRWVRRNLTGTSYNRSVSFPVMAEGKVYVATDTGLYALGRNGRTVWSRALATGGVAYDDGRVFAIDQTGTLQALSAATGKVLWTTHMSGFGGVPPTAFGDFVYIASSSEVAGVRQDNGLPVWETGAPANGNPPAVDKGKVYATGGCAETSALQRTVGVEVWRYSGSCSGGGGAPNAVHGGRVYARDFGPGVMLDTLTGMVKDSFVASNTPAFSGGTGYFVNGSELYARDEVSGIVRWRYRAPGDYALQVAPVVAGRYVYTVDGLGRVIGISRATGRKVWQSDLHAGYPDSSYGRPGIAAAGDTLVVSYGGRVVGYRHGRDTPGINDPDKPRPTQTLNLSASRRRTWYRHPVILTASFEGYASDGTPIEIQADRWPYGRYRRIARRRTRLYEVHLKVRPPRNTRYRAVYRGTYPVTRSRRVRVFSDVDLRFRLYARGRRHVLVRVRIAGPRSAHLRRSRWFVYFFRRHARVGRRLGALRMRGSRTRVKAERLLRTPRLRRSDLFLVCRRERRDDGFGRWYPWMARCGARRLR